MKDNKIHCDEKADKNLKVNRKSKFLKINTNLIHTSSSNNHEMVYEEATSKGAIKINSARKSSNKDTPPNEDKPTVIEEVEHTERKK